MGASLLWWVQSQALVCAVQIWRLYQVKGREGGTLHNGELDPNFKLLALGMFKLSLELHCKVKEL